MSEHFHLVTNYHMMDICAIEVSQSGIDGARWPQTSVIVMSPTHQSNQILLNTHSLGYNNSIGFRVLFTMLTRAQI